MEKTSEEVKELATEVVGDFYGNQFMSLAGAKLYMNLLYTLGFDGGFPHCYSHDLWKVDTKEHVCEYDVRDFPVSIDINEYKDISFIPNETDDVKSKIISVVGKHYGNSKSSELAGGIIWNNYIFVLNKSMEYPYSTEYDSYDLTTGEKLNKEYEDYPKSPIKIFEGEFKDISHMKFNKKHLKSVGIIK